MYVRVCLYVCMYVCVSICMYVHMCVLGMSICMTVVLGKCASYAQMLV